MNEQLQKGRWFSPAENDLTVKNDLQKQYGWFTNILYWGLLAIIGGYLLVRTINEIRLYGVEFFDIIKIVVFGIMLLAGIIGIIDICKDAFKSRNAVFYVKTCRIVSIRGERPRKYITWYVTVQDGDEIKEYECNSNPCFTDEQIAAKKEITIATFDDVSNEDDISLVYILDAVYPNYRPQ